MEECCGTYRTPAPMQTTEEKLADIQQRFNSVRIPDTSSVLNTYTP
ncbi:hypothetical protein [Salmonella enterica]